MSQWKTVDHFGLHRRKELGKVSTKGDLGTLSSWWLPGVYRWNTSLLTFWCDHQFVIRTDFKEDTASLGGFCFVPFKLKNIQVHHYKSMWTSTMILSIVFTSTALCEADLIMSRLLWWMLFQLKVRSKGNIILREKKNGICTLCSCILNIILCSFFKAHSVK